MDTYLPFQEKKYECLLCNILHFCSAGGADYGEPNGDSVNLQTSDQEPEISLSDRLRNAAMLDIESNDFSWDDLSSLYHTKHTSSTEHSEDELNKALEVCCFWIYA